MKKIRLSIVVACYNVEKYLNDCIESLYLQDLPEDEYEVICVNDCSTDSTPVLLEKFQKVHKNFRIINHETNRKVGAVRNTGKKNAKGNYLWFIDGDDIVKSDSIKTMISICENHSLDILLFNYQVISDKGEFVENSERFINTPVLSGFEFLNQFFSNRLFELTMVWTQLYRRDFILEHNIVTPEINIGEDSPFAWKSLFLATNVMSVDSNYYQYRSNEISMTQEFRRKPSPIKIFEKTYIYSLEISKLYDEFIDRNDDISTELLKDLQWSVNTFRLTNENDFDRKERKEFYHISKKRLTDPKNPLKTYFNRKTKRCVFMMNFGFIIWNFYLDIFKKCLNTNDQLIINLNSQLGNQMFYYALYLNLISNDRKVKFDTRYYKDYPHHYRLDIFIPEIPVASETEILSMFDANRDFWSRVKRKIYGKRIKLFSEIEKDSYAFDPEIFQVKNAYVDGYWQSEKYFHAIRYLILKAFTFPEFTDDNNLGLINRFKDKYSVSIHVRRGDYLNGFPLMTPEYYQQAMNIFNEKYQEVFYIVLSNDVEWAKDNIKFDDGVYVDWNTGSDSYKDMQLMTYCNSNIIANSSFSWWGAWLNKHEDKIVVAPSVWLNGVETPDIYAKNWIII